MAKKITMKNLVENNNVLSESATSIPEINSDENVQNSSGIKADNNAKKHNIKNKTQLLEINPLTGEPIKRVKITDPNNLAKDIKSLFNRLIVPEYEQYGNVARQYRTGTLYFINYAEHDADKGFIGIWYANSKSIVQLIDVALSVTHIVIPDNNSKSHIILYMTATKNEHTISFTINDNELYKYSGLRKKLIEITSIYPNVQYDEKMLLGAIQILSGKNMVTQQKQKETIGYHLLSNGDRVYVVSNGVETKNGVLTGKEAPFLSPELAQHANGYTCTPFNSPNDDILDLLFRQLNNTGNIQSILAGTLGLISLVSYPVGRRSGTIPYLIEYEGRYGLGKTPTINFFLSLLGSSFKHNTPTLLNISLSGGDTEYARGQKMVCYQWSAFSDYDNKLNPKNGISYEKNYKQRCNLASAITDIANRDKGQKDGTIVQTGNIKGLVFKTTNYDFAITSLKQDNLADEKRVCTFSWKTEKPNDDTVSKKIGSRLIELYNIGASYRQWCMQHSTEQLENLFVAAYDKANDIVGRYKWQELAYFEQCVDMIMGLHLFMEFLKDVLPDSFMLQWIPDTRLALIQDRLERCQFIFGTGIEQIKLELSEHVLDAIRYQFASHEMYVDRNDKKPYGKNDKEKNLPPYVSSLVELGYLVDERNVSTRGMLVGNVVKDNIVFKPTLLFDKLRIYGKSRDIDFISLKHVKQILEQAGIVPITVNGKVMDKIRDGKKSVDGLIIPLSKIYPPCEDMPESTGDEQEKIVELLEEKEKRQFLSEFSDVDIESDIIS